MVQTATSDGQPALPLPALETPRREDRVAPDARGDVVYMAEPMDRGSTLSGFTYKLKWPDSEHAIYITVNDVEENGRRRPFEIFINSKNLEHYAWTVALTRMISAVFRRGGDVSFVVEELKAVFDPRGGQWMNGHYVPSLLAAIGEIVEKHMIDIGFLQPDASTTGAAQNDSGQHQPDVAGEGALQERQRARYCPKCQQPALVYAEGCHSCRHCGYSKCS
jgi:ribonucleoside-diphosphate reductase alpha chain